MSAFIGKFKAISSSNLVAHYKECGMSDDEAHRMASLTWTLEFSKKDTIYTIKAFQGHSVVVNQFQLGKEIDCNHYDGPTTKAVMVLDDNKLVVTFGDKKGARSVYEMVGNELRVTTTMGPVVSVITYARQ
ncbi:unnamed protein product [Oppiella nova]|uniref:Uncharacterized protein n=1 Tax=Oppiella nova TaxID=334625 RepID=A0A7R9MFW6_9ACAR|nr:unnamed protein product [Oppiella nova]CAG2176649.1 unnamed protein product [Oppiella nova]